MIGALAIGACSIKWPQIPHIGSEGLNNSDEQLGQIGLTLALGAGALVAAIAAGGDAAGAADVAGVGCAAELSAEAGTRVASWQAGHLISRPAYFSLTPIAF